MALSYRFSPRLQFIPHARELLASTCEPLIANLDTPPRRPAAESGIIWDGLRRSSGQQAIAQGMSYTCPKCKG